MDYFSSLLDANFLPHGHCFRWTSDVFWLHLLGDGFTALAYYLIPGALAYFVIKRKHLPYPILFILFSLFILACGTTHIFGMVTIWNPVYRLEGWVKVITALVSMGTAMVLYPVIPKALKLRTPEELENLNRELELKNRELAASRESFQNIVNRNKEGILVIADGKIIVFANQAACGFLSCEAGPLIGKEFTYPLVEDRVTEFETESIGGGKKAAEMWVSDTQWAGRAAFLVNLRDISIRKQAEEALRQSQLHVLQQSQKMEAVGRLTGGIAHDFNNVLTAISGFSSMALSKMPEESPIREEIQEVARAGERASQLTRQLLAFSRKQVPEPRTLDLNQVVQGISTMIRRIISEDIALTLRLGGDLPRIKLDPGQLEQVILNLAINARDAMPNGGELLVETSKVFLASETVGGGDRMDSGEYVLLAVSDNGVGMPPEIKDQLFEPFFTTKESGKGTGLGLSMVDGIVKQAGGYIFVESEPDRGSIFKLYFPATTAVESVDSKDAPGVAIQASTGSETVLLVEDEAPIRRLVGEVLQVAGYTVIEADDGESALAKAEAFKQPIQLLLTDVIMKRMGGFVLFAEIRKLRPGIRVMFMSGYTNDVVIREGIQIGDFPFLQKPFSPSQLLDRVRQVLDAPETELHLSSYPSENHPFHD